MGGLRVLGEVTRVGVFDYSDTSGNQWKEYRPPEEVGNPASLDTLKSAPVTDLHPTEGAVTPDNWRSLAVGNIGDDIRFDDADGAVLADVVIQDGAEVKRVLARERKELSCGYDCDIDQTPGEAPDGTQYDCVQRNIRYNHVALGPVGWGRGGPDVALRMDGAAMQVTAERSGDTAGSSVSRVRLDGSSRPMKLKFRGKEYRLDSEADVAAMQSDMADYEKKSDAQSAENAAVMNALTEAMKQLAALKAALDQAGAGDGANTVDADGENKAAGEAGMSEDKEPDPAVLDSLVEKRAALLEIGRKFGLKEEELTGKRSDSIKRAVIRKLAPKVPIDGLSASRVDDMFTGMTAVASVKKQDNAKNKALEETARAAEDLDSEREERSDAADDFESSLRARTAARGRQKLNGNFR